MPKLPTPAQMADKWSRRIKASTQDVREGVIAVEEAPTLKALAKKEKMRARLNEALDNGKWEAGLRRVSLEDWRKAMLEKGLGRIAQGADMAISKVEDFAAELLPHIEAGQRKLEGMPDVTIEDSITRVGEFLRHMAGFRRRGGTR